MVGGWLLHCRSVIGDHIANLVGIVSLHKIRLVLSVWNTPTHRAACGLR